MDRFFKNNFFKKVCITQFLLTILLTIATNYIELIKYHAGFFLALIFLLPYELFYAKDFEEYYKDEQKRKEQKRKDKKAKRYKVCKLREKNGEELIMYETYSFFKAYKEYNRLKFKYPSLYFKLYFKI